LDKLLQTAFSPERKRWAEENPKIEYSRVKLLEHFFGTIDCQRIEHMTNPPEQRLELMNPKDVYSLPEFFVPHYCPNICFFHEFIQQKQERLFGSEFSMELEDIDIVEAELNTQLQELKEKLKNLQRFR